jgi:hypothetical protein
MYNIMGKFYNNFQKRGGFSGFGKRLSGVGGRFMKAGGLVVKVGGFFDPRLAEIGDAMMTAGKVSQGIGSMVQTGSSLVSDLRKDKVDIQKLVQGGQVLRKEARDVDTAIREGRKLRFI